MNNGRIISRAMYSLVKWLDNYDYDREVKGLKRFGLIIISPIMLILEKICKNHIWKNKVVKSMIENDVCFNFLDSNNFEYTKGYFRKCELLDENQFYRGREINETKNLIKTDFTKSLSESIKYIPSNIDDYINILALVYTKTSRHPETGEYMYSNVYEVIIRYYRQYQIDNLKKLIKYLPIILLLLICCVVLITKLLSPIILQ